MDIAEALKAKIETGLREDGTEILALPTYITPPAEGVKGKALVLDLGGTNYRVAVINFNGKEPVIQPEGGWKKDLSVIRTPGFTEEELLTQMADPIEAIKHEEPMPVGYCFSYPAAAMPDGDGRLIIWTKGIDIPSMVGKPVGRPLLDYLNRGGMKFTDIKVINDTVASLFAGLTEPGYDAYIGLIVGTGTNMASFFEARHIAKLGGGQSGMLPVNLESANFNPPHLTEFDDIVDRNSDKPGRHRFEKAMSGMYLGDILRAVFPDTAFEEKFDAESINNMINYPDIYRDDYVAVARAIYERSARLVAASLAGLILVLRGQDPSLRRFMLTAEGGLFWSAIRNGSDYNEIVNGTLSELLSEFGLGDVSIDVNKMENANLIGTGIAALS
jgi:hexokinase